MRSEKIQKKAGSVGFDWEETEPIYDKIAEELGVKPLKLGYMPEGMYFEEVVVDKGYG